MHGGVELGADEALRGKLPSQRRLAAADEQRLRLRERVGHEQRLLVAQRMPGAKRHDELDRRLLRALVQPLEERVLPVRADVAPKPGRRRSVDGLAFARDALAVAFELQLLQVGGQPLERLRVRDDDALRIIIGIVAAVIIGWAVWLSKSRKRESMVEEIEQEVAAAS